MSRSDNEAMSIEIKKMETDAEIRGKAYVHWKSWHEAYPGIVSRGYLDSLTLKKCEEIAYRWQDNILVAKDGDRVAGFAGYGTSGDDVGGRRGEIYAIYVLPEYYATGVGAGLMQAALDLLQDRDRVEVTVLKENGRAIRFYEKCGFRRDGTEETISLGEPVAVIRMVLERER